MIIPRIRLPLSPVPLPGFPLTPLPSLLPLYPIKSLPPPPPHHSHSLVTFVHLLPPSSKEPSADMDMNVNLILGPIVLAVVVNVSSILWVFLSGGSCDDCNDFLRLCCMGRVWCSGTPTGSPGSKTHGIPGNASFSHTSERASVPISFGK
jgi:hypothetical protein